MTTATAVPAVPVEPARPSLARLTAVELRKMTDTRSGRWLLILIALTAVVMTPLMLFAAPEEERTLAGFLSAALTGVSFLLPVLGILSVTQEWSQRTTLTTFALVPERHRVVAAKLAAGALLGAAFVAAALAVAAVGRGLAGVLGRSDGAWTIAPSQVATTVLFAVIAVFSGVAFGMLFMNSPLAIVLYFALPTAWSVLTETVDALKDVAGWLDTNRTLNALLDEGITWEEWARAGTSLAVWLLIPLLLGLVRLTRREVK
ncbi:ABC transporter permease [Actinomadura sp. NPDC047616]|uniref:ABC transporter permease n=1 Tax=Actinomadura sp. NPDC047616 TaxID=3155914 RepID=UPI0033D63E25